MPHRMKSILLVALQFLFILLLISGTPLNHLSLLPAIFIIMSFLLILWAMVAMQKSKLRIMPEPSANATLVTHGPYRFIRHPMYSAILLGALGLLISYFTWVRLIMVISLAIVLISKLTWEEKLLRQKFEEYSSYCRDSKRLIPFLY
jgi:protein-S-isoprenylcysteine O-methyltransferase Ste14